MADDISKKILLQVEADTNQLDQSVAALNQTLDGLLQKQKQLSEAGQQNTKAFQDMAAQVKTAQAAIDNHSKAVDNSVKAISSSNNSLQQNKDLLLSLLQQYDSLSKSEGNHSDNVKALNTQISTLSNTITDQVANLNKSSGAFDAHKATMNALSSSFDKLKGVSGTFGPSLQDAAKGFDALKSGLSIVQTGFTSVGEAIKTTGFGLLVLVLKSVVDYFTKTTEGSAKLRGAISAVGLVVSAINHAFENLGKFIVDAVTHPVASLQTLGNMIKENIIDRFKAFSVILDGIMHLDFKKVGDGVIQAVSGVTHATDKIGNVFKEAKNGIASVGKEIANAYITGTKNAGKAIDKHEKNVIDSNDRIIESNKKVKNSMNFKAGDKTGEDKIPCNCDNDSQDQKNDSPQKDDPIDAGQTPDTGSGNSPAQQPADGFKTDLIQKNENQIVAVKKTAIQQVEDYAKQSAGKIASDAFSILNTSIKQQSAAKIASLEKDKTAELSNTSLTSAQKIAINQKYKLQEAQVKEKAFKTEQEASIASAVINGALAITKAEAQTGMLGTLVIPGIIAETAVQVAKIAAQKPPAYAKGGLHYSSDGRGGVLAGYSKTDNTNAYLRSGEGIVVSEAMRVPWARNLVSAINVGFGGRDFSITNPGRGYAVGGIFTDGGDANRYYNQPVTDQKNLANTIAYQMINNFPPVYVDVKDVNNQQNILAQTINRVNL
jgi:hypothetical protein